MRSIFAPFLLTWCCTFHSSHYHLPSLLFWSSSKISLKLYPLWPINIWDVEYYPHELGTLFTTRATREASYWSKVLCTSLQPESCGTREKFPNLSVFNIEFLGIPSWPWLFLFHHPLWLSLCTLPISRLGIERILTNHCPQAWSCRIYHQVALWYKSYHRTYL